MRGQSQHRHLEDRMTDMEIYDVFVQIDKAAIRQDCARWVQCIM